jgi:hypothetical protein
MTDNPLVKFDHTVALLTSSVRRGSSGLHSVPGLVKQIVREDMWQKRIIEATGELVECKTFAEFITSPPPKGVGADVDTLKRLCHEDTEAFNLIVELTTGKPGNPTGRNQHTPEIGIHSIRMNSSVDDKPAIQGTTREYGLRRLRKDAPELHAEVLAGNKTVHQAMLEAGLRRKTASFPLDPDGAARAIIRHFEYDDLLALVDLLVQATQGEE